MSTASYESDYQALIEPHRRDLHAHCYRMLGSVQDAEDALQEALLRAWKAFDRFEGRAQPKTWLYRIATNTCLDMLARRKGRRELPIDRGPDEAPLTEIAYLEPYPDDPDASYETRESLELAFIAALQHLPALQRAVLIEREVLGFSAAETAASLDTTVASVNSALQRARRALDGRLPERSQQETLRTLGDEGLRGLVTGFVDAWERGDVDAIAALLAEDATIAMPPAASWYAGRSAVAAFIERWATPAPWRFLETRAGGQLAFGTYLYDAAEGRFMPHAIDVITVRGAEVLGIMAFCDPALFGRWGLPPHLLR